MSAYREPVTEWGGAGAPVDQQGGRGRDECLWCPEGACTCPPPITVKRDELRDLPLEDPGDHAWRTYEDWPMSVR